MVYEAESNGQLLQSYTEQLEGPQGGERNTLFFKNAERRRHATKAHNSAELGPRLRELVQAARGSQEAGFTQPRGRLITHLCSIEPDQTTRSAQWHKN